MTKSKELNQNETGNMVDLISSTEWYTRLCSELHDKYPPIDEDYPEEYWTEFNNRHEAMLKELIQIYNGLNTKVQ